MDDQQNETTTTTTDKIGPDDSEPTQERQAKLLKIYEANVAGGKPPYAGVVIGTRGELKWIIAERGWNIDGSVATIADDPDLRGADIRGNMSGVVLYGAKLSGAYIETADFTDANLSFSDLRKAYIMNSSFNRAVLTGANLRQANIFRSDMSDAQLIVADCRNARLGGASPATNFTGADLTAANLSGALIAGYIFKQANLTQVRMDASTVLGSNGDDLTRVQLDSHTRLLDVSWNGAILALINWDDVPVLGDEIDIKEASARKEQVQAYQKAARAYFGLARALEAQGLSEPALRYRRRQQQLERAAQLRSFNLLGWLFSCALNIVSGYGDRPLRAFGVYLAVILTLAGIYFGITTPGSPIFFSGSQPLQLHEAVVFSLSSFHGRGFFPSTISLGDPVAIVAALEAVVGLFIELVLIATFTRRLFER